LRIFSLKCREVIDFLDRYLEGELSPQERREFELHLRLCRSCRAYLKTYRETLRFEEVAREELDREVPESVPEELVLAILQSREL
jgi:anti-sigma factor RsiW